MEESLRTIPEAQTRSPYVLKYLSLPWIFSMMFFSINCRSSLPNGPGGLAGSPGIHVDVEAEPQSEAPAYTLQIGDELDIKFFYDPELNEKVTIRPDGKISLGLIDDLQAAGLTPAQLDQEITHRYSEVLKEAHVTVIVREFVGQRVYVGGEVLSPRMVPLKGKMTALQCLHEAGGTKDTAKLTDVVVIRNQGGTPVVFKVDLQKVLQDGNGDLVLRSYDIIYVPKTFIAKADLFVEQHINQIIPKALSVTFPFITYLSTIKTKDQNVIRNVPSSSGGGP